MKNLVFVFIALFLVGCSNFGAGAKHVEYEKSNDAVEWNPQSYSGQSHWKVVYGDDGNPKEVLVYDGKEKQGVKLNIDRKEDGSLQFSYDGTEVKAFTGQGIRANVETGVVEFAKDVSVETMKAVVEAVRLGLNPASGVTD